MDIVSLPVLDSQVSPRVCLNALVSAKRSAAVIKVGPVLRFVTSTTIRKAINRDEPVLPLAECEEVTQLHSGSFATSFAILGLPAQAFNTVRDHLYVTFPGQVHTRIDLDESLRLKFEEAVATSGFALMCYDRGCAVLLSRHESTLESHAGPPKGCCCGNPDYPHEYASGTVTPGSNCARCKPKVYPVNC